MVLLHQEGRGDGLELGDHAAEGHVDEQADDRGRDIRAQRAGGGGGGGTSDDRSKSGCDSAYAGRGAQALQCGARRDCVTGDGLRARAGGRAHQVAMPLFSCGAVREYWGMLIPARTFCPFGCYTAFAYLNSFGL